MERFSIAILATMLLVGFSLAAKRAPQLPDDPRDVPREAQLTMTKTKADLDGDGHNEELLLVNALTGNKDPAKASEVIVGVVAPQTNKGRRGALLWSMRISQQTGAAAHNGNIEILDLDGDGNSEMVLSWDRSVRGESVSRWAQIYAMKSPASPSMVWEGVWEQDTRRDTQISATDKEWFERSIDYSGTRKAAGRAIVFRKIHKVIAGKTLEPPRVVSERVAVALRHVGS